VGKKVHGVTIDCRCRRSGKVLQPFPVSTSTTNRPTEDDFETEFDDPTSTTSARPPTTPKPKEPSEKKIVQYTGLGVLIGVITVAVMLLLVKKLKKRRGSRVYVSRYGRLGRLAASSAALSTSTGTVSIEMRNLGTVSSSAPVTTAITTTNAGNTISVSSTTTAAQSVPGNFFKTVVRKKKAQDGNEF
jgi:hypothetical protein